jgi:phage terminase large subunit GpA-like protein
VELVKEHDLLDYSEALKRQLSEIFDDGIFKLSTIKPSDWNERHRSMDSTVSRFEGKFSYKVTPYTREIVDCLAPDHPARIIAVMKGAQIGFSTGVIEAGIGWIISENPGNILFLTGHADLSEEAVVKIDNMIDSCGIRHLIRPSVQRVKNNKTGDTNTKKEFPGGSLVTGSAGNHKLLRQRSVRYGFIDDFEAAKHNTKESGSTRKMIEQRFAAYADKMKLYYISTPELKQNSNIEPVYLLGDQRKYHIPCPCCGEFIDLQWSVQIDGDSKEMAGITWKTDVRGRLLRDSVGYICQKCGGFFTDHNKADLLLAGFWKPTSEPSEEGFYSYHLSSLYAPAGMYDWRHYVNDFIQACPEGKPRKEDLYKAFVNLVLGETYEEKGEAPRANELQKNIRNYEPGIIPEKLSIRDGNGHIVLLTCACDLNGKEDDARLDYEVVGWSESGASYSITHGSIGTFIPREDSMKHKEDRERWTYELHRPNSVWPEYKKVIETVFLTDTGRKMKPFFVGIDTGHYTNHAYAFIDRSPENIVGLKGKDVDKFIRFGVDLPSFRPAKERPRLYLIEVNQVKDDLADRIKLRWDEHNDDNQPPGFMNFPTPTHGLYTFKGFFSHFEAEHRVIESKEGQGIAARWLKKSSIVQNHFWDVHVYNMVLKDILVAILGKELKRKDFTWKEYVDATLGRE